MDKHRAAIEAAALRDALQSIRDKLHAYNRPQIKAGLRIELRADLDAALRRAASLTFACRTLAEEIDNDKG